MKRTRLRSGTRRVKTEPIRKPPQQFHDSRLPSGALLPAAQQSFFAPRIGTDLGQTRIHTDERAQALAERFNARAFTWHQHIFFNRAEYQPGTMEGQKLLAHELAHVVQDRPVIARKPKDKTAEPPKKSRKELAAEEEAARKDTVERLGRMRRVWVDLAEFFPGEGRKVAGTGTDDSLDYLTTSFKEGDEVVGCVTHHYTAPIIKAGKKYAVEPDTGKRQAALRTELDKIDEWRFRTWRIDDGDVSNSTVTGKIGGLNAVEKTEYVRKLEEKAKHIANTKMQEYIRLQLPSTPVAAGATPTAAGGFEYQFDNVTIRVRPDVFNSSEAKPDGGITRLTPVSGNTYPGTPAWKSMDGVVTEITDPPQKVFPVWEVQTHYGAGADPAGASGYGYGTTAEHQTANTTSLRFHEGGHGTVFIEYIRDHIGATPYPEYTAAKGDSEDDLKQKHKDFKAAVKAFRDMLDAANKASEQEVDCAGKSIEKYHEEHGTTTTVHCEP